MALAYHEPVSELSLETREYHRAIASLIEEFEAVDWYHQRADATGDESLKGILLHNRDEEIEHACMMLEWLRRRIPKLDEMLHTYLFTSEPITQIEGVATEGLEKTSIGIEPGESGEGDLGLGKLAG